MAPYPIGSSSVSRIAALRYELIWSVAVTIIPCHILGIDQQIDKGLAAFIATLHGSFEQIPLERAWVRHLPLFLGLRKRCLTWIGVAGLLTARDVRGAQMVAPGCVGLVPLEARGAIAQTYVVHSRWG